MSLFLAYIICAKSVPTHIKDVRFLESLTNFKRAWMCPYVRE